MHAHLIANMYVESIIINSEVYIILWEWSREVNKWKECTHYIDDIVIRNLNSLVEGEQS